VHVDHKDSVHPVKLDMKGIVYRGAPRRCNTFAVVDIVKATSTVGEEPVASQEAKITHFIDSFLCVEQVCGECGPPEVRRRDVLHFPLLKVWQ